MLLDIVGEALNAQPDMEVVEADPGASLLHLAGRSRPDVVIIGADDPSIASDLVMALPRLKVLAVTGTGYDASLYELRPHKVQLGEVTPRTLVEEIRRRTGEPARWTD
jgi:chemotaxis response regulator CheB